MTEKKVLLLGAGMVSGPFVDFFTKQPKVSITVAAELQSDLNKLLEKYKISTVILNVDKEHEALDRLVSEHDLVVSLLPFSLHPTVAKVCIKNKKNMVTSSYVSPELQALDQAAKEAGIIIMNESGLDPGIDHMLAMECFDSIREEGGKITSFESFCGGLPAPEASENPLRYKFSWSPKGVFTALGNPARFLKDGKTVDIAPGRVIDNIYPIDFMPGFNLIGYANRDSTKYADIYGLGPECETLIRGTLRYQGFGEAVKALEAVGLLNNQSNDIFASSKGSGVTWKQQMGSLLCQNMNASKDELLKAAAEKIGKDNQVGVKALDELGLFNDVSIELQGTAVDTLAAYLAKVCAYQKGERDMVVLNHDIKVQLKDESRELHRISMVAYGEPNGYSAMSRTVGYTCGIVANMVLQGEIQEPGVLRPIRKEVYRSALKRLADFDITANRKVIPL